MSAIVKPNTRKTGKLHAVGESGYALCRAMGTKYLGGFQTDFGGVNCKSCLYLLARQRGELAPGSRLLPALNAAKTFPATFTLKDLIPLVPDMTRAQRANVMADLVHAQLITRLKKGLYCIPGREPLEASAPTPVVATVDAYEQRKRELGIHVERREEAA